MTPEQRTYLEDRLQRMPLGEQLRTPVEGHRFVFMLTNLDGLHTGRSRFLVACETCSQLVHVATTGPVSNVDMHVREANAR